MINDNKSFLSKTGPLQTLLRQRQLRQDYLPFLHVDKCFNHFFIVNQLLSVRALNAAQCQAQQPKYYRFINVRLTVTKSDRGGGGGSGGSFPLPRYSYATGTCSNKPYYLRKGIIAYIYISKQRSAAGKVILTLRVADQRFMHGCTHVLFTTVRRVQVFMQYQSAEIQLIHLSLF